MKKDLRKYKAEGDIYGRLKVIEYLGSSTYLCYCNCGNYKNAEITDLKKGKIKSCGCLKKEQQIDIVGKTFNRLTVLERVGQNERGDFLFNCLCDCGNEKVIVGKDVKRGKTLSCGNHGIEAIKKANTTHGDTGTRLYYIYLGILKRCNNINEKSYGHYGGRGIKVCDEWQCENGYSNFKKWALDNGYKDDLTIDRIDNDGDYSPDNCRWANSKTQANNRRNTIKYTYKGETKSLSEWSEEFGLIYGSLWKRLNKYNYSFEEAVTYKIDRIKIK